MSTDFDMGLYLKLTGADGEVKIGDKPDLDLLKRLLAHHVCSVFYQNYDLLMNRSEVDLSPKALLNRLLVDGRGGMCYESCELMLHVLREFKFDARRVPVFTTVNGQVYYEGATRTHNIIVVYLGAKKYLVDCIFGFNSVREPLDFSFESTEEHVVWPGVEEYRLECAQDHYMLHMRLKGNWGQMYHILRPVPQHDLEAGMANYRVFLSTDEHVTIRDSVFKVGTLTEEGRVGFTCSFDGKCQPKFQPPYTMILAENRQAAEVKKLSYQDFKDGVKKYFDLTLQDN